MLKKTIIILLMLVSVWIGFSTAFMMYHPDMRIAQYSLGIVPFCQLIEADRLKVCPTARLSKDIKEGGRITLYVCDGHHAFVETNNVPKEPIKKLLKIYKDKGKKVVGKCETEFGKIYEMVGL
jgi:hypothetical protein